MIEVNERKKKIIDALDLISQECNKSECEFKKCIIKEILGHCPVDETPDVWVVSDK